MDSKTAIGEAGGRLRALVAQLPKTLRPFIDHAAGCSINVNAANPDGDYCTCGVRQAIEKSNAIVAELDALLSAPVNRLQPINDHSGDRLQPVGPIALTSEQERQVKLWAADDRLWTTQETVEFNLRTFARLLLSAPVVSPPQEEPPICCGFPAVRSSDGKRWICNASAGDIGPVASAPRGGGETRPLPPDIVADALQDRLTPASGRLLSASPVIRKP